jgi:RimJ/RimL family protein N-acetyltransferase
MTAARGPQRRPKKSRRPAKRSPPKKPFVPSDEPRVSESEVEFLEGKGSTSRSGGGPGGCFWHIRLHGEPAGRAYINYYESGLGNPRPSVTVMLNQKSRGRGIGTVAFRKAAELSPYDEVYATVAKKNVPSRIALERAGFKPVKGRKGGELYLVWKRGKA